MTQSVNLAFPFIAGAQAQKHVTHNEALRVLDTLVQLAVLDRDLSAPPGAPAEGQRFIVAASPTGAWAGRATHIAAWQDGGWQFYAPKAGWIAFVLDEAVPYVWSGSAWTPMQSLITALQNLALLGIGTLADAGNPFSAKLNKALWVAKTAAEGGDGDLRYTMSKESAAKTLSLLMQTNFSGRAEIGLTGDDDLRAKVSADGAAWRDAFVIDRASGRASFPAGISGVREQLLGARTYFVRTDGSDANDGLADSAGGAFLTIQKAIDTVAALDLGVHNATIQIGPGSYAQALTLRTLTGAGEVTIRGDAATPANVIINPASTAFTALNIIGRWKLQGMKLAPSAGNCLIVSGPTSTVDFLNVDFAGGLSAPHISVLGGRVQPVGNYMISAGTNVHIQTGEGGAFFPTFGTMVTLTGTPAFSATFARAFRLSYMHVQGMTFSGVATGKRYDVTHNSVINAEGAGATFLPGDVAGTAASGGQYV